MTEGFILVNKPKGMTSHDVVDYARKTFGIKRIGHAGTLDPMASGLLILAVGKATKEISKYVGMDKEYTAEFTLGATSNTDDVEGNITKNEQVEYPTKEMVKQILKKFIGEIEQVPPIFSALKVNGQRAYKMARQGKTVELKPRKVTVYSLELADYDYPIIKLKTKVSSGTYIRALARDIGKELGTGAYMSSLVRTKIGSYSLQRACELTSMKLQNL